MSLVPSKRPHTDDATTPVSPVPDITNSDQQPDPKTKCAPRKKKVHPPWHTCQGYGVTDRSRKARDVWGDYMEDYWFMAYDRRPYEQGLERVNLTTFAIAPYVPVYLVLEHTKFLHMSIIKEDDGRLTFDCQCPDFIRAAAPTKTKKVTAHPDPKYLETSALCAHHCLAMRYSDKLLAMEPRLDSQEPYPVLESIVVYEARDRYQPGMVISIPGTKTGIYRHRLRRIVTYTQEGVPHCSGRCHKDADGYCCHIVKGNARRELQLRVKKQMAEKAAAEAKARRLGDIGRAEAVARAGQSLTT